jgi:D-arabinitol 2-dehydrogenase
LIYTVSRTDPCSWHNYTNFPLHGSYRRALTIYAEEEALKQASSLVAAFKSENPSSSRIPRVTAHYADVSDAESVQSCVAEIVDQHGKIDCLVTSAGIVENFDAVSYPVDRMRKLWGVNVDGTYLFAVEVAKHLVKREEPGSMVFIGSMSAVVVNVPQPQA